MMDSYFWYMPFASPWQCKHVKEVITEIPEDEWMTKRTQFAAEHELLEVRAQLKEGFHRWLDNDYHKENRANKTVIPTQTDIVM